MKHSEKTGVSFGITSAIITTVGLMVGLHSTTHSKLVVIGGVLTIAIADAFSDALGIHISEESEGKHTPQEIWRSTIATFLAKFIFALTFLVPIILLQLSTAIIVSVIYGMVLLGLLSFYIVRKQRVRHWQVIAEHLFIAFLVIIIAHYVGDWVSYVFH